MFIFIWIYAFLNRSVDCYRFEPNTFNINSFSECPGNQKYAAHVNYSIVPISRNRFVINGEIVFSEVLGGKLEVKEMGAYFQ